MVVAALGGDPARTPGAGAGADEDVVAAAQRAWQQVSEHEYSRFTAGELNFDQMRLSRMSAFLRTIDRPGARRLDHELMEHRRNKAIFGHFRLFDDVPAALHRLRATAVRVLSNSDGAYQRAKLTAVGLGDLAADGFFSGDLGVAKPDPGSSRWPPTGWAGRRPRWPTWGTAGEVDVMGSLAAGMASVWLNRAGADRPDGQCATGPVAQIATLDELVVDGGGLHLG